MIYYNGCKLRVYIKDISFFASLSLPKKIHKLTRFWMAFVEHRKKISEFDGAVKDETNVRLNMKAAYVAKIITKTFVKSKTLLCSIMKWYSDTMLNPIFNAKMIFQIHWKFIPIQFWFLKLENKHR